MKRTWIALCALCAVLPEAAACGISDQGLFAASDGGPGGPMTDASPGNVHGPDGTTPDTGSTATPPDAGPVTGDAGTDALADAPPPPPPGPDAGKPDAGAKPDGGGPIGCGSTSCATGKLCCVYTPAADGGAADYLCALPSCPPATGGQQRADLGCTSTADCAPGVCCVERPGNDSVSKCAPMCNSGSNQVQFCDPNAADSGCPANAPCSTNNISDWNLPPTFATCGGVTVP